MSMSDATGISTTDEVPVETPEVPQTPDTPGLWDVCTAPARGSWERTLHRGLDLGSAMAWGEAVSEDYASFSVERSAAWRKSKPSDAQLDYANVLGIDTTGMRRGEVSQAIDLRVSADIFDRYVKA